MQPVQVMVGGQHSGAGLATTPIISSDLQPLSSHLLCLGDQHRSYIASNFRSMSSLVEDYLELIVQDRVSDTQ